MANINDYTLDDLKCAGVGRAAIARLKEANITFIDIKDMIDNDDYSRLKTLRYIGDETIDRICVRFLDLNIDDFNETVVKEKEDSKKESVPKTTKRHNIKITPPKLKIDISKYDLTFILNKYIIHMLQDTNIPKFAISSSAEYPIDDVLFGKYDIYIKESFIRPLFKRYINTTYNIKDLSFFGEFDSFNYAVAGSDAIYDKVVGKQKYAFNKFPHITGNEYNYIKIFKEELMRVNGDTFFIEVSMNPFTESSYCPEIDLISENMDDTYETVYSTSNRSVSENALNKVIGNSDLINNISSSNKQSSKYSESNSNRYAVQVIINSCKQMLDGSNLAVFTVISRVGSKHNFDTKMDIGTYQFKSDDLSEGTILFSGEYDTSRLKERVINILR